MENLTFIIPLHKYDDTVKQYLKRCVDSVVGAATEAWGSEKDSFIMFAGPQSVLNEVGGDYSDPRFFFVSTGEKTGFFDIVNDAVMMCSTKFFTVVEFDDAVTPSFVKDFDEYHYTADFRTMVYMPICQLIKPDASEAVYDKLFSGFANEIAWSSTFAENYGEVDRDMLENYLDFNVTGAVINTEDFITVGKLNGEFGIVGWYEFLLRAKSMDKDIYVLPKCTYMHTVGREGSFMEIMSKDMDHDKVTELITRARENCGFATDKQ